MVDVGGRLTAPEMLGDGPTHRARDHVELVLSYVEPVATT